MSKSVPDRADPAGLSQTSDLPSMCTSTKLCQPSARRGRLYSLSTMWNISCWQIVCHRTKMHMEIYEIDYWWWETHSDFITVNKWLFDTLSIEHSCMYVAGISEINKVWNLTSIHQYHIQYIRLEWSHSAWSITTPPITQKFVR